MGNASTAATGRSTALSDAADSSQTKQTVPSDLGATISRRDSLDNMRNAGAGWYFDPEDEAIYRYWDGQRWTDHRSDTVLSTIPS